MRRLAPAIGVATVLALAAVPAEASFHLMKVTEVALSSGGNPGAQFVELRDDVDEPFPAKSAPYELVVYDGAGTKVGEQDLGNPFAAIDTTQPFLIASSAAGLAGADAQLTVALPPGSGQVCFTQGVAEARVHCIAYGCPTSPVSTAQPGRAPADGQSLQRVAAGLALGAPTPGAANVAGASAACGEGGGGGGGTGGGGGGGAPPPGGETGTHHDDGTAPVQRLAGRRRQDVDRLALTVRIDEAGSIAVRGSVKLGGRSLRFRKVTRKLDANAASRVRLRLSAPALAAVKRALRAGRHPVARIAIAARDEAGNVSEKVRRVTLTS